MQSNWIVRRDEAESQPLTFERLVRLADSGRLRRTDVVRQEHETDWRKASDVRGLFISTWFARLSTVAAAAILSVIFMAMVRKLCPTLLGGGADFAYGLWKGSLILGYDPSGYGGMMLIGLKNLRSDFWLPQVAFMSRNGQVLFITSLPIWVLGTVLLSIPAFFRPRRYSVGSLFATLVEFVRLSPAR